MQEASLLQPLIGMFADKFSVRYFVILAPAVTAAAMSLLGVANSYATLVVLLLVAGVSSACLHAVGPVMAANVSGRRRLGLGMSIWMVGGELGRFVGPLAIGLTITTYGREGTPWLMLGGIVASIALLITLKEPSGLRREVDRQRGSLRSALKGKAKVIWVIVGSILVQVFAQSALQTYLPVMMHEEGETLWLASVSLSILQAAGVVGAMFGGTLSDRLGRRMVLFLAVLPTSMLMYIFLAVSGWVRFPILALLGFTAISSTPVMMAIVQETFPQNRALANGAYMALNFLARSFVVLLTGWLGDLFGMHTAFIVCATLPLLGLPLFRLLPARRTDPMDLSE
jgi:FSR family fosmidomycin resistance protein-like MFS transporter